MPIARINPSPRAARALLGLALLASLTGCEAESSDCKSNDDCPDGKVCNLLAGVCIVDVGNAQDLAFSGSFACSVNEARDPMADAGTSELSGVTEVIGGFGGVGIRFDTLLCMYGGASDGLTMAFIGVTTSATAARDIYMLSVRIPAEPGFDADELSVLPGFPTGTPPSGRVGVSLGVFEDMDVINNDFDSNPTFLAVGESGSVLLTGDTMPGDDLMGTLDLRLMAFGDGTIPGVGDGSGVGESCEELTDCDFNAGLVCLEEFGSICAGICETQADCDPVGGVCTFYAGVDGGFCFAACEDASDCAVDGVRCVQTPGASGPSCANGYIPPDDPEALGAPCSDVTACPTTACLTWSGDQGLCTNTCETNDDCAFYVGVDTTCRPLASGDSVCLQRCDTDADCPDHLACLPDGDETVCVISRESTMPTDPPASPTVAIAIQRLAEIQCALDFQCNPFLVEIVAGDEAYCVEQLARQLEHAATLPGSGITINNADACTVLYERATCEEWKGRRPICPIPGTIAQGEPCADSAQCRTAWCEGPAFSCGVCAPGGLSGAPCEVDVECNRGDACSNGECVRMPDVGQACTAAVPCFGWAACVNGTCRANDRQLGQSCGPEVDQPFCELDPAQLVCNANACVRASIAAPGQPCPASGWCGDGGSCVDGTCEDGPGPNDTCSDTARCRWPTVCIDGLCRDVPTADACAADGG